ncbi:hypothetical protein PILCRDRAFT_15604 [Piloderma croceum F 1598]|uniref:Uncharacterized protein n=1 Tax=Piloderma croceum (strain F 1598) TaxID=765440 RepID=A0A0C3B6P1_PILCF|nr:hypothetical protein PILCRDRAFT_15604 [Piloderma croceum F 1598]
MANASLAVECVSSLHRPRASVSQDYVDVLNARNERLERQLAAISSQNMFSSSLAGSDLDLQDR